jgi:ubiquitin-conjugating enzyme E2 J1
MNPFGEPPPTVTAQVSAHSQRVAVQSTQPQFDTHTHVLKAFAQQKRYTDFRPVDPVHLARLLAIMSSAPVIKRLMKEHKDFREKPTREFFAYPLETNMLEWHFTMRGPPDSPYSEGFYHGKIVVPSNYPFAPPDCILLTPNGRFELNKVICLSVSSYHPESWRSAWGLQMILFSLRQFMITPGNNGIGAIEYPPDVRRRLATESHAFSCPTCGHRVADDIATMDTFPEATPQTPPQIPSTPSASFSMGTPSGSSWSAGDAAAAAAAGPGSPSAAAAACAGSADAAAAAPGAAAAAQQGTLSSERTPTATAGSPAAPATGNSNQPMPPTPPLTAMEPLPAAECTPAARHASPDSEPDTPPTGPMRSPASAVVVGSREIAPSSPGAAQEAPVAVAAPTPATPGAVGGAAAAPVPAHHAHRVAEPAAAAVVVAPANAPPEPAVPAAVVRPAEPPAAPAAAAAVVDVAVRRGNVEIAMNISDLDRLLAGVLCILLLLILKKLVFDVPRPETNAGRWARMVWGFVFRRSADEALIGEDWIDP